MPEGAGQPERAVGVSREDARDVAILELGVGVGVGVGGAFVDWKAFEVSHVRLSDCCLQLTSLRGVSWPEAFSRLVLSFGKMTFEGARTLPPAAWVSESGRGTPCKPEHC